MNPTASQPENQSGDVNGRFPSTDTHPSRTPPAGQPEALDQGLTDRQFRDETPDEAAAALWFIHAFWPNSPGIRCPRCAWNETARLSAPTTKQPYRCARCREPFSIKIETVMSGSPLTLRQWKLALFIWAGGPLPSSSKELERRMGVDEGTAHDLTLRILESAREEFPPLREPAELARFQLGGKPQFMHEDRRPAKGGVNRKPKISVIAMVGRHSGRTTIRKLDQTGKPSFHGFVHQHLSPGMDLYLSNHRLHQDIPRVAPHYLSDNDASYLLLDLRERTLTIFDRVHNGFGFQHAAEYLDGIQWWENHRNLSHREKMIELARGMRWKKPPPSTTEKKRIKRALLQKA